MTVERFWAILVKRWILIVACFVVVGSGAYIASKFMVPQYASTAIVQVDIRSGSNQADYTSLLASDQLVQTEAELAVGDPVLREVASHYAGVTVAELEGEASSTPKLNTQLFDITVIDSNTTRAANIANDIARTLISQQVQQTQQESSLSQQQMQQDLANTQSQINDTTGKIAGLQNKSGSQGQLVVLQAQLSGLQQHYTQLQTVLAQLELSNAQSGNVLRIAQIAQPALKPVKPNVLFNTGAGLLTGLLLGILLAVLFEQLNTRVRNPEELRELLDWTVLGTIWRSRIATARKQELINPQSHDANVEAYRILRTNVGFSGIDSPLRTLMVTSAMPGDGKSTIAANLAIYMAKAGKNTLLVDADLRRPTQHQLFGLGADKKGFSNAVLMFSMPTTGQPNSAQFAGPIPPLRTQGFVGTSGAGLEQFIHSVGIPNLRVMPSGPLPPNPSELLDSRAMQRLREALSVSGAEVIIFDAPPIRGISDANILASKVDGTMVVVDVTRANKHHLKQVKMLLMQAGAHVLGCVVNKQRRSRSDSSYSYYYYYRHEEGTSENNNEYKSPVPIEDEATSIMSAARNGMKVGGMNGKKGGRARHGK